MLRSSHSPAELMERVNQALMQDEVMEETFASLLLMRWEPAEHRLTYANAGHCRPILVKPDGPEVVAYSDIILGLDAEAEFTDTTVSIPPGSAFVTYTDGLIEQRLETGEMAGEQGVMEAASAALGSEAPIDELLDDILRRSEKPAFEDDILVFWLERFAS